MKLRLLAACCLALLLAGVFAACNKEDPYMPEDQQDFFPLQLGDVRIYQLDSIIFDPSFPDVVDSVSLQLREEVVDTFTDNSARLWYRIDRFERTSDTLPWMITQVIAASIQEGRALLLENNLTFIKLIFPFDTLTQWDGHVLFDTQQEVIVAGEPVQMFKDWGAYDVQTRLPEVKLLGKTYTDVVTILQADNDNLIERRFAREQYAKGTGLIHRELHILDTQEIDPEKPWEEKAEKGFILRQTLVDHF